MESDPLIKQRDDAIERIVQSESRRKLVVAGPGTGKTFLFRRLLQKHASTESPGLVFTLINNLKDDLERDLKAQFRDAVRVFTFHGYCHRLLRVNPALRVGLTEHFRYLPGLASLIKQDWRLNGSGEPPHFVDLMRELALDERLRAFYLLRSDYYDAVEFDDSVYRVFLRLTEDPHLAESASVILVDEFQDFNALEGALIELLAKRNPIVIAGDDDQALYAQIRRASSAHIRALHQGGSYDPFPLPFCMRCTDAVVGAANDIVAKAQALGLLSGRIQKPYLSFPPKKGGDSTTYPQIRTVCTSVQRLGTANYMGRYLERYISKIPQAEVEEAARDGFPTVLVIGERQYLAQIRAHLEPLGLGVIIARYPGEPELARANGIELLAEDGQSSLGWRILTHFDDPKSLPEIIQRSIVTRIGLVELLPAEYKASVLEEVARSSTSPPPIPPTSPIPAGGPLLPTIRLVSFEGSKGLSAQHVFIVGLQNDVLPKNSSRVRDVDICKFLVALTRTRKQCHLVWTNNFSGDRKSPSDFIRWIDSKRTRYTYVDKDYWKRT